MLFSPKRPESGHRNLPRSVEGHGEAVDGQDRQLTPLRLPAGLRPVAHGQDDAGVAAQQRPSPPAAGLVAAS